MAVILAVPGVVSSVLYYFFIVRRGVQAASDLAGSVGGAVGKARWWMWKRKNIKPPHELIDTPVLSAATMMYCVMRVKGDLSEAGWAYMRHALADTLRLDDQGVEDTIVQARFIAAGIQSLDRFVQKQSRYLASKLTQDEFNGMHQMITEATTIDGDPTHLQQDALKRLVYTGA